MSHEIDTSNNRENMAYVGEVPWHGLGNKLTKGAPLEQWSKESGQDWEALKSPIRYFGRQGADNVQLLYPSQNVLYRSDTLAPLSIVSDRYQVVQPVEVIQFYRDLCETYGFEMETAGCLLGGRKIWALAKTGMSASILGNDEVRGYLLLATSYDKSMSTMARYTNVRVVCNNTFSLAVDGEYGAGRTVSINHSTKFDADAVKIELQVGDAFEKFKEDAEKLALTPVSADQVASIMAAVYGITKDSDEAQLKSFEKTMKRIATNFATSPGAQLASANGTLWGLFNAVTFEVDHAARARSQSNRLNNAWFGGGETLKNKTWSELLAVA